MTNPMINAMLNHRTIRRFDPEFKIPREHLDLMIKAAQQASTSCSGQMYTIIEIERDKREKLCGTQQFIAQSSYFGIICVDIYRLQKIVELSGGKNHIWPLTGLMFGTFDAGLFSQNLALAAESMGYGIAFCGTCGDNPMEIIEKLKLPEMVLPLTGIAIGKPAEDPPVRPRIASELIHMKHEYRKFEDNELDESIEHMSDKLLEEGYYGKYSGRENYSWKEHMKRKFGGKWLEDVESRRITAMKKQRFL